MSFASVSDTVSRIEEDEEDIGPELKPIKKQRKLENEAIFTSNLPCAESYEKSLMHRDLVNFVFVTRTDFIITTSIDGHVKFWKKEETGIEFVKHFRAHLAAIVAADVSIDGRLFCTASVDMHIKVFDVINFGILLII